MIKAIGFRSVIWIFNSLGNSKWIWTEFINGLRVTNKEVITIVEKVLIEFNNDIVNSLNIKGSKEVLTADIATPETAKILNIKTGDPVVVLNRHSYAEDKKLVEFRITIGRGDMFSYTTSIGDIG